MKKILTQASIVALLISMISATSNATENGQTSAPIGVNTVINGILPSPGNTQYFNYIQYYTANDFVGDDGNTLIPNFKTDVLIEVPRVVHTWDEGVGPFSLSSSIIVPIIHLNIKTPLGHDNKTALGDIILEPFMFSYVNDSQSFFTYFSPSFAIPTGSYSVNDIANTGLNTFAFIPYWSTTWFPNKSWEISTTMLMEANTKNKDTNYQSGSLLDFDYVIGYSLNEKIQIGLQGGFVKQISDDKVDGISVNGNGFRGQTILLGPQIRYSWANSSGILFKYQHEMEVKNRPEGNKFWIQFSFPL